MKRIQSTAIQVNTIRRTRLTSLRVKCEVVLLARATGAVPEPGHGGFEAIVSVVGGSRLERGGACEDGRPAGAGRTEVRPVGVRAAIVAEKPGNAGGAKGGREVESTERGGGQTSRYRLPERARKPEAEARHRRREVDCAHYRKADAGGRSWVTLRRGASPRKEANCRLESRVREIRTHGSEGGAAQTNASSLPLSYYPDISALSHGKAIQT